MSEEDDILNKMDALLKRHQPSSATPHEIPMLSEVVAQSAPHPATMVDVPVLTSVVEAGSTPAEPAPAAAGQAMPHAQEHKSDLADHAPLNEAAMEQLLHTVNQHISQMLVKDIAPQLLASLDSSVSAMMVQLNSHIEQLVRDAITGELQKYLDNFVVDLIESGNKPAPDAADTSREGDSV